MRMIIALPTRTAVAGLAMLCLIVGMLVLNAHNALSYHQRVLTFRRFMLLAIDQCSRGNVESTRMLLVRVRSLAPDAADEDYARETQLRVRSGECTIIMQTPPAGFVDLVNP